MNRRFQFSDTTAFADLRRHGAKANGTRLGGFQHTVDAQIQDTGFVPEEGYGANGATNGNVHSEHPENADGWKCSEKQRNFIQKICGTTGLIRRRWLCSPTSSSSSRSRT